MQHALERSLDYYKGGLAFCGGESFDFNMTDAWQQGWLDAMANVICPQKKPRGGYTHGKRKLTAHLEQR